MPRRHRSARDRPAPPAPPERPSTVAPAWASAVERTSVRAVTGVGGKAYRCPGCQQVMHPGTPHLVVVTEGDVEGRRHWHTPCWRREVRRLGYRG
jgi:hypothetical protein